MDRFRPRPSKNLWTPLLVVLTACAGQGTRAPQVQPSEVKPEPVTVDPVSADISPGQAGACGRSRLLLHREGRQFHLDRFAIADETVDSGLAAMHLARRTLDVPPDTDIPDAEFVAQFKTQIAEVLAVPYPDGRPCAVQAIALNLIPWHDTLVAVLASGLPRPKLLDDGRAQQLRPRLEAWADALSGTMGQVEVSAHVAPPQHAGLRALYSWIAVNLAHGSLHDPQRSLGTIGIEQSEFHVALGTRWPLGIQPDARFRIEIADIEHSVYARGYAEASPASFWTTAKPEVAEQCARSSEAVVDEARFARCSEAIQRAGQDCSFDPCASPICPQFDSCQPMLLSRSFVATGGAQSIWRFTVDEHARAVGRRDALNGLREAGTQLCGEPRESLIARHGEHPQLGQRCSEAAFLDTTMAGLGLQPGATAVNFAGFSGWEVGAPLDGTGPQTLPSWLIGAAICAEWNCIVERPRTLAEIEAPPTGTAAQ